MLTERLAAYLNGSGFDDDKQLFHYPFLIQDSVKFIPLYTPALLKCYFNKLRAAKNSKIFGSKFVVLEEKQLADNFKILDIETESDDYSIPKERLSLLALGDKICIICFEQEALPQIEGFTKLKSLELTRLNKSQQKVIM